MVQGIILENPTNSGVIRLWILKLGLQEIQGYRTRLVALIFLGCKGQLTRVLAENSSVTLTVIKVGTKESLSSYKKKIDSLLYQP